MGDLCTAAGKNSDDDDDDTSSATAAKKNAIAMANAEAPPNTTSPVLLSHATQERRT
jgi:hypothetical protein